MSEGPKIVQLGDNDARLAALEKLKREVDQMLETGKVLAKYRRGMFLAYIEAGFSESQALELCKTL